MNIFISDFGTIWGDQVQTLPPLPAVAAGFGDAVDRVSYTRFAIRPGGARIVLGCVPLRRPCFERLIWLLLHFKVERAVLQIPDRFPAELLASFHDIVARLDELRYGAPGEAPRAAYFWERLSLDRLGHQRRAELKQAMTEWKNARGRIGRRDLTQEVGRLDGPRMLLRFRPDDAVTVEATPQVLRAYRPCEKLQMLGSDIGAQPDPNYGDWVAQPYRAFRGAERPSLELIEAVIAPPGGVPVRSRYERLLLPWSDSSGERWVTATALVRSRRYM